jgi:hypothetical protein
MSVSRLKTTVVGALAALALIGLGSSPASSRADDKLAGNPAGGDKQTGALTLADFDKLHRELMRDELWLTIPWKTSIREARELAVKEKKPIAFWYVQGNVLSLC